MLGVYSKADKELNINKEGILNMNYSKKDPSKEKENHVYIWGDETLDELTNLITDNEKDHRHAVCLLIFSTLATFESQKVKKVFLRLKNLDNELYQKLEKTDLLKKVGIKPKWKFW